MCITFILTTTQYVRQWEGAGEVLETLISVITGIIPGFTAHWASVSPVISELSGTVSPGLRLGLGPDTSRSGVL